MKQLRSGLFFLTLLFSLFFLEPKSGQAQRGGTPLRYVMSGGNALVFGRPERLCGGDVHDMGWSPDGMWAAALHVAAPLEIPGVTQTEPAVVSLSVWRNDIQRAHLLWSAKPGHFVMERPLQWLPGSAQFLLRYSSVDANGTTINLLLVNAAQERLHEITLQINEEEDICPNRPLVIFKNIESDGKNFRAAFRILNSNGAFTATGDFPANQLVVETRWSENGAIYQVKTASGKAGEKKSFWYALNTRTGEWTEMAPPPNANLATTRPLLGPSSNLRILTGASTVERDGVKRTVHPAWLASEARVGLTRALIAAECAAALPSPKDNAVLYRTPEGVFILPLIKIAVGPFTEMRRAATLSDAEQISVGIEQYVQFHKQKYPPAGSDFAEVVGPYMMRSDVFEDFTYFPPEKKKTELAHRPATIIGTVAGPGGEAVIYADGHVKWRDKKGS